MLKKALNLIVGVLFLVSCADRDKHGKLVDTPTSGSITIAADESLKPLVDAEINAFEAIYKNAHIRVIYTYEGAAIDTLLKDSARLVIITRRLAESEEKALKDQAMNPRQLKVAIDGVALIVNRQNPDTLMQFEKLKKILLGELNPNEAGKTKSSPPLEVVFDQPNSGIIRYLKDSIAAFDKLPKYCFAVESNAAVVDYVSKKPQAMGLIDVSWISDREDSTANSFLNSIRVVGISRDSGFYQPYQAYMAQKAYPLLRDVVMISREARTGLGSGFMAFVAGEKGQRVVLKSGLVPATMPVRIVEVNHEPL